MIHYDFVGVFAYALIGWLILTACKTVLVFLCLHVKKSIFKYRFMMYFYF